MGTFLVTALHDRPTDTKTIAKLLGLGNKVRLPVIQVLRGAGL